MAPESSDGRDCLLLLEPQLGRDCGVSDLQSPPKATTKCQTSAGCIVNLIKNLSDTGAGVDPSFKMTGLSVGHHAFNITTSTHK